MSRRKSDPVEDLLRIGFALGGLALLFLGLTAPGLLKAALIGIPILLVLAFAGLVIAVVIRRRRVEREISLPPTGSPSIVRVPTPVVGRQATSLDPAALATPAAPTRMSVPAPAISPSAAQIRDHLQQLDWFQFELAMEAFYRKLGYEVCRRGGARPDGGIDLELRQGDRRVGVQCKHWKVYDVGVKVVRELMGALSDAGMTEGILLANKRFTADARELAARHRIELLDGAEIAALIVRSNAWLDPAFQAALTDPRKLCPRCESPLVERRSSKSGASGKPFWGCAAFPRCRYTMEA